MYQVGTKGTTEFAGESSILRSAPLSGERPSAAETWAVAWSLAGVSADPAFACVAAECVGIADQSDPLVPSGEHSVQADLNGTAHCSDNETCRSHLANLAHSGASDVYNEISDHRQRSGCHGTPPRKFQQIIREPPVGLQSSNSNRGKHRDGVARATDKIDGMAREDFESTAATEPA